MIVNRLVDVTTCDVTEKRKVLTVLLLASSIASSLQTSYQDPNETSDGQRRSVE